MSAQCRSSSSQDDGRAVGSADAAEQLRRGVEGAVADLLGVVEDALDVATLAPLDADQVAEQMGMAFRQVGTVVVQEQRDDALLHLPARRLDAVVVGDLEAPGDDVAQKSERLALRLRRGAAAEEEEALGARVAPGRELVEQAALADAGIGHHGDGGEVAIDEQPLEGVLQRLELGVAADHPCRDAFDAAAAEAKAPGLGAQHQIALDGLVHALDGQRLLTLDLEHAAHLGVGIVADAQGPGRRGLLHARGDVHRDAANAAVGIDPAAEQHAAGVDADADVEAVVTVRSPHFGAERLAELEQGQAAAHGTLGIVFAGLRRRRRRPGCCRRRTAAPCRRAPGRRPSRAPRRRP